MRYFLLLLCASLTGCSKTQSTAQPEPVPVNRKFFDDPPDPSNSRTLPNPKVK